MPEWTTCFQSSSLQAIATTAAGTVDELAPLSCQHFVRSFARADVDVTWNDFCPWTKTTALAPLPPSESSERL